MTSPLGYAAVVVDIEPMHLDRLFDYAVPAELAARALPGARVRVKFAGRKADGYIHHLSDSTELPEKVQPLADIVGVPVVSPAIFDLARSVADRWVGTLSDVLRAAVPSRHARAEAAIESALPVPPPLPPALPPERELAWQGYAAGPAFLAGVAAGRGPRAALCTLPGDSLFELVADAVQTAAAAGRGALVVVPDYRDLAGLAAVLAERMGAAEVAELHSGQKPAERYSNHLSILRGERKVVVGTRAAAFAPVADLALVVVVDDGDDLHSEQHAPYWHSREVLALRSKQQGTALLAASTSRSADVQQWVESGWAVDLAPDRDRQRRSAPIVRAISDSDLARDPVARAARLPAAGFTALRAGLREGPVLVQVPRRGYQLHLRCQRCRQSATCSDCDGALERRRPGEVPLCSRCGNSAGTFKCRRCGGTDLRSGLTGAARTAEEIGRAFPDVRLITSGRDAVVAEVEDAPALVICTPGAEPRVRGGRYRAAVVLDAELTLDRADLRAHEEAFRRWQQLCSLITPVSGTLLIAADDSHRVVQALIRQDPVGFAARELAARREAGLTPALATFEWRSPAGTWQEEVTSPWPAGVKVLGPVGLTRDGAAWERVLINCPRALAPEVAARLRAVIGRRAAAKRPGAIQVRRDPVPLA